MIYLLKILKLPISMNTDEQTSQLSEVMYISRKLDGITLPPALKEKIDIRLKRLRRMARQGQAADEYESVAKYVDWCISVPWDKYNNDNLDLVNAKAVMDQMHYGSEDVKQNILEYLAVLNRQNKLGGEKYASPVLAFVGVQGAGKTTLAQAIAKALGRPFYRISLGAFGNSAELRGAPLEQITSQPGQIIRALVESKCMNPVILLDEFDKVSGSESLRSDFMAIMLEILDPSQNTSFRDWYVDYPVDLSRVMFIATANKFKTLARELLDRMEIVQFNDYSPEEKTVIAKNYLFPEVLKYAGLKPEEFLVTDQAWPILIKHFGTDKGVRRLRKNLELVARKVIKSIVLGEFTSFTIDHTNAEQLAQLALPSIEAIRDIDYTAGAHVGAYEIENQEVSPNK